jgi:cytochrome c-type biogenesis protein CcsB
MKKILPLLISIKTTILLFLLFALCIAAATFIENDYGTQTAWALIFKTKWFEVLQLLLMLNLLCNIVTFKMYTLRKLPILLFHLSFIFILVGAFLTRYYGYEGMINIREGHSENRMLSSDSFLQTTIATHNQVIKEEEPLLLSKLGSNDFEYEFDINGHPLTVSYNTFIASATKQIISDEQGIPMIKFMFRTRLGVEEYVLKNDSELALGAVNIFFNKKAHTKQPYIYIYSENNRLYFKSNFQMGYTNMADDSKGVYTANTQYPFDLKRVYESTYFQLLPQSYVPKAKMEVQAKANKDIKNDLSALVVNVTYKDEVQKVALFGKGKGFKGYTEQIQMDDAHISLEWGSKVIKLPFRLHLKDFVVEKYLGSQSPSSYESKVIVMDGSFKTEHRIYMNNTLSYKGFTFYQSSYEQDEKGTILSVNSDPGKWPTYMGYFLLMFGLLSNLMNPHSRFFKLAKTHYVQAKRITPLVALMLFYGFALTPSYGAMNKNSRAYINTLTKEELVNHIKKIDAEHSNLFASMLIQTKDGRVQPVDSFAQNVLNKILGGKKLFGLTHSQVFVGMVTKPRYWQRVELFKIKHPKIKQLLGLNPKQTHFSYVQAFSPKGEYKFLEAANMALRTKPSLRDTFEKEVLKIDERLNIAYTIFEGMFLRFFPLMNSDNEQWFTAKEVMQSFPTKNKQHIETLLRRNIKGIYKGYENNNWAIANEAILQMIQYQTQYANFLPSHVRVEAEILYNKLALFQRLYPVYILLGFMLLIFIFMKLFKPNLNVKTVTQIIYMIFIVGFVLHTFNLGLRWYIAEHAPWSNSYEAMLYISWTILLAGILFARESDFALSTTGIFSGITLFVAHLSWLDPQITNLVPVLKSYWLTIHVSVITASYGFLGLSFMLGFITLLLYFMVAFIHHEDARERLILNIKESVRINELSMTIGISLLIIGNFLGAIWANESWGRYWGWDPKETWTLVTILVYAAIIHIRYIPKFSNKVYLFSTLSLVAYSTVIMTYFGVNYYLTGLHSYASGDPVPIPTWVYYVVLILMTLIVLAFRNRNILENYTIETKKEVL